MLDTNLLLSALAFTIALTLLFTRCIDSKQHNIPLPPGPKGLPIIGNLRHVQPSGHPEDYRWKRFLQWSQEYNSPDAVSVQVFGQRMIILNSRKATIELLEKRSANYSDRPRLIMTDELSGWKWDFAHMRYSDQWRLHRKTFHQWFQPRVMPEYYGIQRAATEKFIQNLATSLEHFV
ncbi:cytochrome P450 [Marasmius fiardii PR-910]|nr:cytochrome P450 [Marasmius fiardii PR-910]